MQKVISFDKSLEFKTMIGEITSISLDQELSFLDDSSISGELIVSGKYKLTSASRLEEDFRFNLPIEIVLTERLEEETRNVRIEDFRYEIGEDDTLNCHIELLVEGVEIIDDGTDWKEEILESSDIAEPVPLGTDVSRENEISDNILTDDSRNLTSNNEENIIKDRVEEKVDTPEKTKKDVILENTGEQVEDKTEDSENVGSLFSSFKDSDETFATYSVYIFRQTDTIEAIMDKYQVSKEELENYNDLSNIIIGSKIIIPTQRNE